MYLNLGSLVGGGYHRFLKDNLDSIQFIHSIFRTNIAFEYLKILFVSGIEVNSEFLCSIIF